MINLGINMCEINMFSVIYCMYDEICAIGCLGDCNRSFRSAQMVKIQFLAFLYSGNRLTHLCNRLHHKIINILEIFVTVTDYGFRLTGYSSCVFQKC